MCVCLYRFGSADSDPSAQGADQEFGQVDPHSWRAPWHVRMNEPRAPFTSDDQARKSESDTVCVCNVYGDLFNQQELSDPNDDAIGR